MAFLISLLFLRCGEGYCWVIHKETWLLNIREWPTAILMNLSWFCSETMLSGESRFHISTPLGIEPGSLMTGSKWLDHWTSVAVYECSEIAGSPQGSPPAADYVGCEAGRRTCRERETRTEELCEIKWDYHMSARRPSDGSGWSPPQTRPQWSIRSGSPM
jgi:hypothetical protein